MNASAEFTAPAPDQPLLRAILRGALRLLFRGLVRPPMPIAGQRLVLRMLTATPVMTRGVTRTAGELAGRPCEWHRPEQGEDGVLLYLHGGAYLIGGPSTHRSICASLAKRGRLAVCALDYRLAPEHPFPAARDDALAAYRALLDNGHRPERIFIGGDSAGGNLTLVTTLRLLQEGLPPPAGLVCLSPLTDATGEHLHQPPAGDPLLHRSWMDQAIALYCPPDLDRRDPGLSPLYGELAGLPPLLIQVAEDEVLLNDSLRLAERARAAGVRVTLERYPGLWHVFQAHAGMLRSADLALARIAAFIDQQRRRADA
ncbi:alpha/beta hydrolase [Zestomonas carbonaria]|uniref:Acetyl-hydrolase LipR n=1 Tax=Zestomonas carbonaria TaxID=2762745 RepID=A0A7U7ER09_9GAMM|nr:alpha/beta hydrolase [Pseudomonas carbonaria]CAD5109593.1 Putative acetyl-hydrolase LipR [Pseudomonas carbonaria]